MKRGSEMKVQRILVSTTKFTLECQSHYKFIYNPALNKPMVKVYNIEINVSTPESCSINWQTLFSAEEKSL